MNIDEYATKVTEALNVIKSHTSIKPKAAIILGSGLGKFAEKIDNAVTIPYGNIPNWKTSTAPGHVGCLICGTLSGVPVVAMQGRLHCYEGYTPQETTFPVRVFGEWGVKILIVTNASGGVNWNYKSGDIVLITDHINLTGANPLTGANYPMWGPRFPDMSHAYSKRLIDHAQKCAKDLGQTLQKGVYLGLAGPSYETPAEIRMARTIGADLVGMSTVHETIVANQMGIEVCGLSCVSNPAAGMRPAVKLSEEEVLAETAKAGKRFTELLSSIVARLPELD